ncbi:MAG: hypothetical protein JWP94_2891, partial [Mucilaginibacter sp.]|nr:hypothetical protein [Mucilaginibacter sp.]
MKLRLLSILFFCGLLIATGNAFGAAATISYTAPPVYSFGTLITTLTPTVTNAGSAPTYSISPSVTTNTGLTFSTTTGAISGTPSKISVAVVYTVTLTPGGTSPGTGTPTATVTITVTARVNNWTGGTAAWATTGNWSAGVVPTVNDSVRIGVVTFTNAPTISVAGALARAVTFGTVKAGTLTITSPGTLAVSNGIAINAGVTGTITGTGNITAGSATFTGAGSILTLTTIPLTVTNALTITAGATATITGTGSITAGSATFGTGSATSLTLTTIPLTVSNTLSINAGALATLTGTGSVSTKSLVFSGASASLTLTTLTLTATNDFTVNTGATATITGTGNVNIKPLAALNVVTTGVLTTNMTGKFTLKSDATGSASVGQILATSVVGTGKDSLRVERFITGGVGHRGYYLMSSPVYVTTVSSNNVYDMHYLARAGMYLTGTTGFDKSSAPSLYLYREDRPPINNTFTSGNFWGVSKFNNTNVYDYNLNGTSTIYNVPAGNGFMVFFRGNRTGGTITQETYTTFVSAPTVTLTAVGRLNAGQVTFHDWYRPALATLGWSNATANTAIRGYNLVGNPYASTIDWETYQTSSTTTGIYASANVGNTIYEYDPVSHVYSTYQKGGAKTGNATRYIVSGQGFYVQATVDSTEQLIFNESAKANAQNTGVNLFMSTRANMAQLAGPAPEAHLRLTLVADSVNHEDTYIGFNSAASTKYAFNEDAPY